MDKKNHFFDPEQIQDKQKKTVPFKINRSQTTTKTNKEYDSRLQWTSKANLVICGVLLISVATNVYQSVTGGGLVFYAQDIRTGSLSDPIAVSPEKIPQGAKIGPAPFFSEQTIARLEKKSNDRRNWLDGLDDSTVRALEITRIGTESGPDSVKRSLDSDAGEQNAKTNLPNISLIFGSGQTSSAPAPAPAPRPQ